MGRNEPTLVEHSKFLNQLHIYGLFGIAVAYPLYSFLRTNPAYLVINGVTSDHLYLIIVLLSFVFPTILVVVELELRRRWVRVCYVVHTLLIAFLVGLSFLPLLSRIEALPVWLNFGAAAILTVLVMREYRTNKFTYVCFGFLAPVAFAFPLHFATDYSISQILSPQRPEGFELEVEDSDALPPVVMVVFDAFPLVLLLDAEGNIDKKRFPNFVEMGQESTWYSYATTVHDVTIKSVPSILTGRYPVAGRVLPLPENYPGSLFEILRGHYRIHAYESATNLSASYKEGFEVRDVDPRTLTTDLAIFYLRSLLPLHASDAWLPLEDGVWGGFLARMPDRSEETQKDVLEWQRNWHEGIDTRNRYAASTKYVGEMASYPRNTFHFFHIVLPHGPYGYLPTGNRYLYSIEKDLSGIDTARLERAAHTLQAGLADTILGEIRSELIEMGHWDDALVVVVADHGEAYQAHPNRRVIIPNTLGEVGYVPLLIKYPGQEKGAVDDTNVQSIDVAPTILDVLDIETGPRMDGRSLIDEDAAIPEIKTIMSMTEDTYRFYERGYRRRRAEAHEDSIKFFTLTDSRSDLFNFGPGLDYLGAEYETLLPKAIACRINVVGLKGSRYMNSNAPKIDAMVKGTITGREGLASDDVVVAISVNGTIRAVTRPYRVKGGLHFHKVISETYFREGKNDFNLLLLPSVPN